MSNFTILKNFVLNAIFRTLFHKKVTFIFLRAGKSFPANGKCFPAIGKSFPATGKSFL